MMVPNKGMDEYDPSSKYDHIFLAVTHNMKYVTKMQILMVPLMKVLGASLGSVGMQDGG